MQSKIIENQPEEINIPNIIALTAKLAQVMAQEVDLLDEMKIKQIVPLQEEKQWLTKALEVQLARVRKRPELLEEIDSRQREDLRDIVRVFEEVRTANFDRLMTVREVNLRMVEAIKDVVREASQKASYKGTGDMDYAANALSVTLNEQI
jgi:flagellar biosynthesis/type III secretory pathway chaperone